MCKWDIEKAAATYIIQIGNFVILNLISKYFIDHKPSTHILASFNQIISGKPVEENTYSEISYKQIEASVELKRVCNLIQISLQLMWIHEHSWQIMIQTRNSIVLSDENGDQVLSSRDARTFENTMNCTPASSIQRYSFRSKVIKSNVLLSRFSCNYQIRLIACWTNRQRSVREL